jgi:hypothetical protein
LEVDKVIEVLCDATFLGYEVAPDKFAFVYDNRKEDRQEQAKRTTETTGVERFRINPPFHARFEITIN